MVRANGQTALAYDVVDSRCRVHLELPRALADQVLDGGEIFLVDMTVLSKFLPVTWMSLPSIC